MVTGVPSTPRGLIGVVAALGRSGSGEGSIGFDIGPGDPVICGDRDGLRRLGALLVGTAIGPNQPPSSTEPPIHRFRHLLHKSRHVRVSVIWTRDTPPPRRKSPSLVLRDRILILGMLLIAAIGSVCTATGVVILSRLAWSVLRR
jgi:hypothetical protein